MKTKSELAMKTKSGTKYTPVAIPIAHPVPIVHRAPRRRVRVRYKSTLIGDVVGLILMAIIFAPAFFWLIRLFCQAVASVLA